MAPKDDIDRLFNAVNYLRKDVQQVRDEISSLERTVTLLLMQDRAESKRAAQSAGAGAGKKWAAIVSLIVGAVTTGVLQAIMNLSQ